MVKGVVVVRRAWLVGRMMVKMVRVLEAGGKVYSRGGFSAPNDFQVDRLSDPLTINLLIDIV